MARSMSELIELQNTGSLDKAVIEEVRKEGLPEFLSSAWKGIAASESPAQYRDCLLYTSPSPRDRQKSRMPSSA